MEDLSSICPFVQILDLPVPQMVDKVLEFFRLLDLPVAKQVIEVPKVSSSSCPSRAVLGAPQVVEQLVEVPAIVSYSSLQQRSAEPAIPRKTTFVFSGPGRGGGVSSVAGASVLRENFWRL